MWNCRHGAATIQSIKLLNDHDFDRGEEVESKRALVANAVCQAWNWQADQSAFAVVV
jgi:hypothetical protein